MNKRGLSSVITTVLIILLVIVAVLIVWSFVKPFIFNSGDKINVDEINSAHVIPGKSVMENQGNLTFVLERKSGSAEIKGYDIVLTDSEKNSAKVRKNITLSQLESKKFEIKDSEHNLGEIIKIEVYVVLEGINGKEIVSRYPVLSYNIEKRDSQEETSEQPVAPEGTEEDEGEIEGELIEPEPLPEGLVAYYRFEDNLNDESGNNLAKFGPGEKTFIDGQIGKSPRFSGEGTGEYVQIKYNSNFNYSEFSISYWVNLENNSGWIYPIYSANGCLGNGDYFFLIYPRIRFGVVHDKCNHWPFMSGTTATVSDSSTTIGIGNWYHIVGVYNGSATKLYVDGIKESERVKTNLVSFYPDKDDLWVAKSPAKYPQNIDLNGTIDELMIFNKSLSDEEIVRLFELNY